MGVASILLDSSVYLTNEEVRCVKPDGSSEEPKSKDHYSSVAKVEQCWDEVFDLQLRMRWGEEEGGGEMAGYTHTHTCLHARTQVLTVQHTLREARSMPPQALTAHHHPLPCTSPSSTDLGHVVDHRVAQDVVCTGAGEEE